MTMSTNSPLVHRAVLTVPGTEKVLGTVRKLSSDWLTSKFGAAPMTSGLHHLNGTSVLANQAAYRVDGTEHAIRLQLREDNPEATWRTTVTAVVTDEASTVAVGLEMFPNGDSPLFPGRPRLITNLVRELGPVDGPTMHTVLAQDIRAEDIDRLIDVLCDPARRMPVLVAAKPLRPDELWSRRVTKTVFQCAGAAAAYQLSDTAAVDAFRTAIGEHHRVAPGAVRTFMSEVDPAWPKDASRHRFLSVARMSDPRDSAWNGLARTIQRVAVEAQLPASLQTLAFTDEGLQRRKERETALAADRSVELAGMRADLDEFKALLAQADEELKEAARTAELSARTVASLEEKVRIAGERAADDLRVALDALDDAERARGEGNILRHRLRQAGRYDETVVVTPPPGPPASFEELWERIGELDGVLVTADKAKALELDEGMRAGIWAAKAWHALRALDSYAHEAREGFNGGFYQHCTSEEAGAITWSRKQFTSGESEQTMNKWGQERVFPVPPEVHPSGHQEMQAHLKLGSKGSTSPRIYILDDTRGTTKKVIVGYIGPHLTNTRT